VVQKMEGVETRVSYTKEYWDDEKEKDAELKN
jgi:hypothetical protein